jgi:regulator of sigma E protease
MVAGVVFNFILALCIYSMVLFTWGDTYLPLSNMKMGMDYTATFKEIGFEDGDILLKTNNRELDRYSLNVFRAVINAEYVTVLRNGQEVNIPIPDDMMQRTLHDKLGFADPYSRYPLVIKNLSDDMIGAATAGMLPGDSIVGINEIATPLASDVTNMLAEEKGKVVMVGFYRNHQPMTLPVRVDSLGKIGVYVTTPAELYGTVTVRYGFFDSFPAGIQLGISTLKGYLNDMKYVFTKEGASNIGGFGTIGSLFAPQWDWHSFWMTTAFLSIILAFMNILPIPALDGGHVLFLIYEVVTRRKPSDKFMEYAQTAGMILLIGLLLYANGNDVIRFFSK